MLRSGVHAVEPSRLVARALADRPIAFRGAPVRVVAAGKAAWAMAAAFVRAAEVPIEAGVIAGPRASGGDPPRRFEWCDSGHPLPNDASVRAARRALALARGEPRAPLVVLLSGGASAMLALPAAGVALDDKVEATRRLMRAGAAIDAMNCVRKHLSAIKGGRLAAAAAESLTLAISDVHGPVADDPSVIGSGPTVADGTSFADALAILDGVERDGAGAMPPGVREHLARGARGELPETPKPGDPSLARAAFQVIGNRLTAAEGAAAAARGLGYAVHVVGPPTAGEAREAGEAFARAALRLIAPGSRTCVIASGETTVHVRGDGRGGRNLEFALGMATALAGETTAVAAASAGTDGIDGVTDAAGALVDASTLDRARRAGLDPSAALAANDTYAFFRALDDLIVWGPTGTNVGDLHVVVSGNR